MILIDFGSIHNMMSTSFAQKIGLPLIPIKPCSVWLPNNQSSSITHRMLKVPVSIQGVDTEVDFEVWNGARYEVILGMAWLKQVDAWIACKEGAIHGSSKMVNLSPSEVRDLYQTFLCFPMYK
jgi:hypothetical protein